jgi:hypothetical protein
VSVRPKKHMPRSIALKRHFRGYVLWRTQLDTAPSKHAHKAARDSKRLRDLRSHGTCAVILRCFIRAEEALRSVLRALPIFHHLNYLLASLSLHLHRNVTIAATNSDLACIAIGECDSVRWLA